VKAYRIPRKYMSGWLGRVHTSATAAMVSVLLVSLTALSSVNSSGVPVGGIAAVSGTVEDMWLDSDRCYFRIAIDWSNRSNLAGETVDAIARFLNESTGSYEEIASSQGWMVGDSLNATLTYTYDEFGETYWLRLSSKSDENYAEPLSYFERNPFVFYLLLIVMLYLVLQALLLVILKRKGKKGRYEGPDYIKYRRRI
jgi:hypothetical protein